MNLIKIGNYIMTKRKELTLTQEQLAEKVGVSSKGKKTLPSFENYDSTPIVSIRPMKISKVSNGGKDRHAFSKDYDNINYKYKSGCPLYESRK